MSRPDTTEPWLLPQPEGIAMQSKTRIAALSSAVLFSAGLFGLSPAGAQMMDDKMMGEMKMVEVTITNLTTGQPLSPPIVVSHQPTMHLFEVGKPASPELRMLAEEGMNKDLVKMLEHKATDIQAGGMEDKIMPGKTATFKVKCKPGDVISVAAMVAVSNDTFVGIDSAKMDDKMMMGDGKMMGDAKMADDKMKMADGKMDDKMMGGMMMKDGMMTGMAMAYDAGTEENTEKKSDTAGPDMGKGHPATTPPQPISMSKGIMGTGDLDKMMFGWTGPVAKIEMKMMK